MRHLLTGWTTHSGTSSATPRSRRARASDAPASGSKVFDFFWGQQLLDPFPGPVKARFSVVAERELDVPQALGSDACRKAGIGAWITAVTALDECRQSGLPIFWGQQPTEL